MKKQPSKSKSQPVHQTGTRKGEEVGKNEGKEPGRQATGTNEAGRPTGKSNPRDDKGVGAQAPTDPNSPYLQHP